VFTRACYLSLPWARSIQSTPSNPVPTLSQINPVHTLQPCPYPEPDQSSPHPPTLYRRDIYLFREYILLKFIAISFWIFFFINNTFKNSSTMCECLSHGFCVSNQLYKSPARSITTWKLLRLSERRPTFTYRNSANFLPNVPLQPVKNHFIENYKNNWKLIYTLFMKEIPPSEFDSWLRNIRPATGPYPKPDESRPQPHSLFLSDPLLILSSDPRLGLSVRLFALCFLSKIVFACFISRIDLCVIYA
jgi:hypothetical protein